MQHRHLEEADIEALAYSLAQDEHHRSTPVSFFSEPGTVCSVYEDKDGIVMFVRGCPLSYSDVIGLRLDIQFVKNDDIKRNIRTMVPGFAELEQRAKENGFVFVAFESSHGPLRQFCIKRLGFSKGPEDWLVKVLNEDIQKD